MKTILILDDQPNDIESIESSLQEVKKGYECRILSNTNLESFQRYINRQIEMIDLLILDLEFTDSNLSTVYFLDSIPKNIPVIIVSHLKHYQHLVGSKLNVKGFVSKDQLQILPSLVETVLFPTSASHEEKFIFPGTKRISPYMILTANIRFVEMVKRNIYRIHTIKGDPYEITSVSFFLVIRQLSEQKIQNLRPVSQNEIINIGYIKKIELDRSGRLKVELINLPERPFTVSKRFEKPFREMLSQ